MDLLRVMTPADAPTELPDRHAAALTGVETTLGVEYVDDPAAVIIAHAHQGHVTLIAMTMHGRTGRLHRMMGCVCARVIRSGVAPVQLATRLGVGPDGLTDAAVIAVAPALNAVVGFSQEDGQTRRCGR